MPWPRAADGKRCFALRRRAVEVGHGGRLRQPAIAEGPGQHPRRRIIGQFGRAGGGCFHRWHLLFSLRIMAAS